MKNVNKLNKHSSCNYYFILNNDQSTMQSSSTSVTAIGGNRQIALPNYDYIDCELQ